MPQRQSSEDAELVAEAVEPFDEDEEPGGRRPSLWSRRSTRVLVFVLIYLALFATAATVVLWPSPPRQRFGEAVVDGTAQNGLTDWSAMSEAGAMSMRQTRFEGADAPPGAQTAIEVQRDGGTAQWAFAAANLRRPERFFGVGQVYRMRIWVRDLDASGQPIGLAVANTAFQHRPTEATVYGSFTDSSWHLLTRTFVASTTASSDTALYVVLPPSGAMHWQMTGASLRSIRIAAPPKDSGAATKVVAFPGVANSSLDARQWNYEASAKGGTDLQTYTALPTNASLDGAGHLVLTARREGADDVLHARRAYTSARVTTLNKVTIKPGSYVETEIQAPVGVGVRPAFALIGTSISRLGWPAAGELDVLGAGGADETVAHLPAKADPRKDAPYTWGDVGDAAQLAADGKSHRYGVYFDGKTVRFYVDRRERAALWAEDADGSGRSWPFGAPQYLMLTVAVGGADPVHTTFPRQMIVGAISIWSGGVPF